MARKRRVIINYDAVAFQPGHVDGDLIIDSMMAMCDLKNSPVDSIFWNWGEGNFACHPSKVLEPAVCGRFPQWLEEGFDIVGKCHEATKKRDLESFFSHRINGGDNDRHDGQHHHCDMPRFKDKHPEMLIYDSAYSYGLHTPKYNFAYEEVRRHKIAILAEVLDLYDFDGIEVDFARATPVLPLYKQWEYRHELTKFMHMLREMLNTKGAKRGRDILSAARIPATLYGCHYDGIDVETWVDEGLVDILTLGTRSFEPDYRGFLDLTRDTPVKCYPCSDEIHSSDGYRSPPLEVFRGVFTNWKHQGFEGFTTFNYHTFDPMLPTKNADAENESGDRFNGTRWLLHKRVFEEVGRGIENLDKTFVIQRRLGGHFRPMKLKPDKWKTPREAWNCHNVEAQLPALIPEDTDQDVFLHLYVGVKAKDYEYHRLVIELSKHASIRIWVNGVLIPYEDESVGGLFFYDLDFKDVLAEGDNLIQIAFDDKYGEPDVWVEKVELTMRV